MASDAIAVPDEVPATTPPRASRRCRPATTPVPTNSPASRRWQAPLAAAADPHPGRPAERGRERPRPGDGPVGGVQELERGRVAVVELAVVGALVVDLVEEAGRRGDVEDAGGGAAGEVEEQVVDQRR